MPELGLEECWIAISRAQIARFVGSAAIDRTERKIVMSNSVKSVCFALRFFDRFHIWSLRTQFVYLSILHIVIARSKRYRGQKEAPVYLEWRKSRTKSERGGQSQAA